MATNEDAFLHQPVTATCLCATVQLTLPPPTTRPTSNYLCHCLLCRHELGSLFAWQIRYPRGSITVSRGEESLTRWSAPTDVANPETGEKPFLAFCKVCGAQLFAAGHSADMVVRGGALDLEGGEKDRLREWMEGEEGKKAGWWPRAEFFTKRRPAWFQQIVEGAMQRKEMKE